MISQFLFISIAFLLFTGVTYLCIRLIKTLGTGAKAADAPSRWNASTKPAAGGIVFLIAFVSGMFLWQPADLFSGEFWVILLSGILAFATGLWDDISRISASKKMLGQLLSAIIFVMGTGSVISLSGDLHWYYFDVMVTIVFVVGIMNSINMLDNMDAVATIAAMPVFVCALTAGFFSGDFYLWFLASLLAFLAFNRFPSRIFMGDSGSMILGFLIAFTLIRTLRTSSDGSMTDLVVLMISASSMFLIDSLVVTINRLRHGISPSTGGRDHTSHNLIYAGLNENGVALLFVLFGIIQSVIWYLHYQSVVEDFILLTFAVVYFITYFVVMMFLTFRHLKSGKFIYKK